MFSMRVRAAVPGVCALAALPGFAQLHTYRPGFNLFSKDQDVQLGKEEAAEIEKQVEIVDSQELSAYINGIGLGANSLLLSFSRTAETQSDLMGAQVAAQVGYNPIEIARFFRKLEAEGGARGPQRSSSHPNPGNRTKAIEDEIRYTPKRDYNTDTGRLPRMKAIVAMLPPPKQKPAQGGSAATLSIPESRPSGRLAQYQGGDFSLSYPDNWKRAASQNSPGVTIAPLSAVQQSQDGAVIGYGVIVNVYKPKDANATLWQATDEFASLLRSSDPRMRAGREMPRAAKAGGKNAILTTLHSDSIFQGQTEVDLLVTLARPNGMLYAVFVSPESEGQYANAAFDQMLQSLRLRF